MAKNAPILAARKSPVPAPRSASKPAPAAKPAPARPTPAAKPAPAAAAAPAATAKPKRKRGPRSKPMDRALKYVRLADKNLGLVYRLIGNWHGEATVDQQKLNAGVLAFLKRAVEPTAHALEGVAMLAKTGFAPEEARGRAVSTPLSAGDRVEVKAKYYQPELHGRANDFEVVVAIGKQIKLRPTGDLRAAQLILPAFHVQPIEGESAPDEGEATASAGEKTIDDIEAGVVEDDADAEEAAPGEGDDGDDPPVDDGDTGGELDFE